MKDMNGKFSAIEDTLNEIETMIDRTNEYIKSYQEEVEEYNKLPEEEKDEYSISYKKEQLQRYENKCTVLENIYNLIYLNVQKLLQ